MIQHGKSFVGQRLTSALILAALLGSVVTLVGANYLNQAKAAANAAQGTRIIGLAGELLLASPLAVVRTEPPRPAPLQSLEEVEAEGAWLPTWLPDDIQPQPIAWTRTTLAGDLITQIEFQVTRSGTTRPVRIVQVQVDGPSANSVTFAPAPPEFDEKLAYGVVSLTRDKVPRNEGNGTPAGGRDLRLAHYEPTVVNGRPAEAIHIPPTDRPALHGVLWQVDGTHFYVGGYLPFNEIHAIAEGLAPGSR